MPICVRYMPQARNVMKSLPLDVKTLVEAKFEELEPEVGTAHFDTMCGLPYSLRVHYEVVESDEEEIGLIVTITGIDKLHHTSSLIQCPKESWSWFKGWLAGLGDQKLAAAVLRFIEVLASMLGNIEKIIRVVVKYFLP